MSTRRASRAWISRSTPGTSRSPAWLVCAKRRTSWRRSSPTTSGRCRSTPRCSLAASGPQAAPLWSGGRSPERLAWGGRLWPRSDGEAGLRLVRGHLEQLVDGGVHVGGQLIRVRQDLARGVEAEAAIVADRGHSDREGVLVGD